MMSFNVFATGFCCDTVLLAEIHSSFRDTDLLSRNNASASFSAATTKVLSRDFSAALILR